MDQSTADASSNGFEWGTSILLSSEYFPIPVHSFFVASNDDKEGCWNGTSDTCSNKSADRLILPDLDFSTYSAPRFSVDVFYVGGTFVYEESAAIQISTNGGTDWTTVKSLSGSAEWVTETVDLSDYAGMDSVSICLYYNDGGGWLFGLAVDNIRLIEPVGYDVAMLSLDWPDPYQFEGPQSIIGSLQNLGGQTLHSLTLNYRIDDGDTISQNITGLNIAPLGTYDFTHSIVWDAQASSERQDIYCWASDLNGQLDSVPSNDIYQLGAYILPEGSGTDRTVLLEHFSSSNCGPCATQNPDLFAAVEGAEDALLLSYHVWWPYSTDPFYNQYTLGPQERVDYYGNVFAPWVWVDGADAGGLDEVSESSINARRDLAALFTLNGSAVVDGSGTLDLSASVESLSDYWGTDVSIHVAVVEDFIPGPNTDPNANSESSFRRVVRCLLPDPSGTPLTAFTTGSVQLVNSTWMLPPGTVDPAELDIVVFVQDNTTKHVLQSTSFRPEIVGLEEPLISSRMHVAPNPARDWTGLYVDLEQAENLAVELYDAYGRLWYRSAEALLPAGRSGHTLDLRQLPAGVYFVGLSGERGRQLQQFHLIR